MSAASEAITPTAHYTGYVWVRNGLSHPLLATRRGRVLYQALRPAMMLSGAVGGPTLESYLLARHRALDALLERAIARDGVTQVIELACGLSPRGWRFASRYREQLTYVETDLPEMVDLKRRTLERLGSLNDHHRVTTVDVLRGEGSGSLSALAETLDPDAGVAIVVEGLIGYLEADVLERMWQRLAQQMAGFRAGVYLSDIHLGGESGWTIRAFRAILGVFVGARVALHHYEDAATAERALRHAGFSYASVRPATQIATPARRVLDRSALLAHVALARTA
jgi:O-methyltransferase involved in polyketide biosynthesis